jgi:hypothetical protein
MEPVKTGDFAPFMAYQPIGINIAHKYSKPKPLTLRLKKRRYKMCYSKRLLFMFGVCFFTAVLFSQNLTVNKIGEWGTGQYLDIDVQDNYAYCAAGDNGLDVIDVEYPSNPRRISHYDTSGCSRKVVNRGNYVYLLVKEKGLLILNVSNALIPYRVGCYSNLNLEYNDPLNSTADRGNITVDMNFAYITDAKGLHILDVSTPSSPKLMSFYPLEGMGKIVVNGFYAYVMYQTGFYVFDIFDRFKPKLISTFGDGVFDFVSDIFIQRDIGIPSRYIFVVGRGKLSTDSIFKVIDIIDPASPREVGSSEPRGGIRYKIYLKNNLAYVAAAYPTPDHDVKSYLEVYDVTWAAAPAYLGMSAGYDGSITDIFMKEDGLIMKFYELYTTNSYTGLQIFDRMHPGALLLMGTSLACSRLEGVFVSGAYAYGVDYYNGLVVLDIAAPTHPVLLGHLDTPGRARDIFVNGNYAYVADGKEGLQVIDISNPRDPQLVGNYDTDTTEAWGVFVQNNRAYLAGGGLKIIDVSKPSAPSLLGGLDTEGIIARVFVSGNYAYAAEEMYFPDENSEGVGGGFKIINVSNPAAPVLVGQDSSDYLRYSSEVYVSGTYAYVATKYEGMFTFDISNPSSPTVKGHYTVPGGSEIHSIYGSGDYVYLGLKDGEVQVIDVKKQDSPWIAGSYKDLGDVSGVFINDGYIYVSDSETGYLSVLQTGTPSTSAQLSLSRTSLYFAAQKRISSNTQAEVVGNHGTGPMDWSVVKDREWLKCAPDSGSGSDEILVSIDAFNLAPGTYTGTLSVSSPQALNSPQTVTVHLRVYKTGMTAAPFGEFATPLEGAVVSGSIPVTGWVLDDIGVHDVKICLESGNTLIYIGDALFVEGARPDVEAAFPTYPDNYKAGWGYMLLTNFLPHQGNGTLNLYVQAADLEGHTVILGTKTITCDNAHAVKPFGAIDTPRQGGIAGGNDFINWGWALTPSPNTIPFDGSTIQVWVDGVSLGHPVYNQYRQDIENLFPGYNNISGAGGYFTLDTTAYENGVHTIAWSVMDNAGNVDGIGSRYFTILNLNGTSEIQNTNYKIQITNKLQTPNYKSQKEEAPFGQFLNASSEALFTTDHRTLFLQKNYNPEGALETLSPDENGQYTIEIKELERLVIYLEGLDTGNDNARGGSRTTPTSKNLLSFPGIHYDGYLVNGDELKPLPIGSKLDHSRGVFYWQPGPGFLGEYRLFFFEESETGTLNKLEISIKIISKF